MADLTCYRLRSPPDGPVADFDAAIDEKKLAGLEKIGPVEIGRATGKLFLSGSFPHEPRWGAFLRAGFGDEVPIPKVAGASAVLVVRIERAGTQYFLAFTFGYGFMLLRPNAYERGFGLKTSLNVVFEGDDGSDAIDPSRLRSVDAKRVGITVLRSRHQVADTSSLEELDVDVRRDLLNGVTGTPVDRKAWGGRISGRDALYVGVDVDFAALDELCERIIAANESGDYGVRFSFVDDLQLEADPVMRANLEEEVLGFLQAELLDELDLAPPGIVDWERVSGFRYHADRERKAPVIRRELRIADYIAALKNATLFDSLTVEALKRYEIRSVDAVGEPVERWSAWHCLFGELIIGGKTYVLDDGDFYAVSPDYLARIDADLGHVVECDKSLPDWVRGTWERDYNEQLASSSSNYLLLDRKPVKVSIHTTQVEICDVLSDDGCFIHVKRKSDGSSALSHLFAQGFVSGDLLVGIGEYREAALKAIAKAAKERAKADGDDSFVSRFELFTASGVDASKFEVVYAMLGDWSGGLETLPFFSKVMLRQIIDDLKRRNLKVSVKLVPAVYGKIPAKSSSK